MADETMERQTPKGIKPSCLGKELIDIEMLAEALKISLKTEYDGMIWSLQPSIKKVLKTARNPVAEDVMGFFIGRKEGNKWLF